MFFHLLNLFILSSHIRHNPSHSPKHTHRTGKNHFHCSYRHSSFKQSTFCTQYFSTSSIYQGNLNPLMHQLAESAQTHTQGLPERRTSVSLSLSLFHPLQMNMIATPWARTQCVHLAMWVSLTPRGSGTGELSSNGDRFSA